MTENVRWQTGKVTVLDRERRNAHRTVILWLTGLPASGKSTIAVELERRLFMRDVQTYYLDGDNLRHGLNADLGFSAEARRENIRRAGELAKLFADAGTIVIAAFISPYREDREKIRQGAGPGRFIEVYVDCPVDVCEKRDPKGHYGRARRGEIKDFTGVSAPYEVPESPEIRLDTVRFNVDQCVNAVETFLSTKGYINS